MRVVIAGGHGKIALILEQLLSARGDDVAGLIRNPDQADDLRAAGAEAVGVDLERASVDEVGRAAARPASRSWTGMPRSSWPMRQKPRESAGM
ncbi:NAD dependent epimerase/dehydratase [Mycolicibacterium conceptionense]|uniref:NAD dependent epimerase/dehydratase n=1 Tax=Mycolicibacterium conceptionense TaxID=451644 RepID=A0A0U1DYY4_9MYCO|nr:NAD dependent epimerase/dehydratase [Mycolicibacterium conceptionense]